MKGATRRTRQARTRRGRARPMCAGQRSREKMMIDEQRCEERREERDRIAERAPCERIAVAHIKARRITQEYSVQNDRGGEIEPAAHPVREGQQRRGEQDQGVEQYIEPGEAVPVRDRQHWESGLGEICGAIQRECPEMRRGPRKNDEEKKQGL